MTLEAIRMHGKAITLFKNATGSSLKEGPVIRNIVDVMSSQPLVRRIAKHKIA